MRYWLAVLGLGLVVGASGCQWLKKRERAPLNGGESIDYQIRFDGRPAIGTITFEPEGKGFVIRSASPGYPPERVGADLRNPLKLVSAYDLDMVWLPPSERVIGAETPLGFVVAEERYGDRDVLIVERTRVMLARYGYEKYTGFLLFIKNKRLDVRITSSTVPGL